MTAPDIERLGSAVRLSWPDDHLTVTLDRFRDGGSRGLSAELLATTTAPGYEPVLTQATITLTSIRARHDFATRLSRLYKEVDWDAVIETVCVRGLRFFREGEPVLRLTAQAQVEPPKFRLSPLVYDALPTILYGPGGIGKSYLALYFSLIVQHGGWHGPFCGMPAPVLYVDYESEYGDLVDRARRLKHGHPTLATSEPFYRRCHVPFADDLPAIQRVLADSAITFVVIDSLAAACGAELERAETAIRVFNALRSLRVGSLILAHVPKNTEEKTVYGSVFFTNFARSVWEMKKVQEAGEAVTRVGLYHRKCNLGPLQKPIGLKLSFGAGVQIDSLDLSEEPTLAEELPLWMRLRAALRAGARSTKELAEELSVDVAQVKARLNEGKGKWATALGDGKWGLLEERAS